MSAKLETYLEEIGHYLAVGPGREEILSEIRSHILEKAEESGGGEAALEHAIAGYGSARRVAERYLEGREIIAPAFQRHLFRYTAILFAIHFGLTVVAVIFGKTFVIFPFVLVPRMDVIDALMYLPMAFLADLGLVALILHLVTRSKKDIKLPWFHFSAEAEKTARQAVSERPGRIAGPIAGTLAMLALTAAGLYVYSRFGTIFGVILDIRNSWDFRPFFTSEAGRTLSLVLIAAWGIGTFISFSRIFSKSRWINVVSDVVSLAVVGVFLRVPFDEVFIYPSSEHVRSIIKNSAFGLLIFIALMVTIDLLKNLVLLGRAKMPAKR